MRGKTGCVAILVLASWLLCCAACGETGGGGSQKEPPSADDDDSGPSDDDDDNDDDNDITPAQPDDDAWTIEDVARGADPALGIAADGSIHIGYHSLESGQVAHAVKHAGAWEIENTGDVGNNVAMALDRAGAVHLAYRLRGEVGSVLRYGTNAGGAWWNSRIMEDCSLSASGIAADARSVPWVVSADHDYDPYSGDITEHVVGWTRQGATWAQEALFTSQGSGYPDLLSVSIAFDASGARHLAFYDLDWSSIHYKGPAGDWKDVAGRETGQLSWLAVDAAGEPHLAYPGVDNWLRYETHAGGSWRGERMMQLGRGTFRPAIAVDANGAAHIVARRVFNWEDDEGPNELRYVTNRSGEWVYSVVDTLSVNEPKSDLGIAIDAEGYVHIVYFKYEGFHYSEGQVRHAVSPAPYGAPE